MVTGFNTEVEHQGKVFHVQTEDKGLDNPWIETLIYCGGQIVTSKRSPYRDLLDSGDFAEQVLQQRMERQHQGQIREIRNGRFDAAGQMPFGHAIVTSRPFDEVVLAFLSEHAAAGAIKLKVLDWQVLYAGTRPTLRIKVVDPLSQAPVAGARVTVRFERGASRPVELFSADTDGDGFVEASFQIPEGAQAGDGEIVCSVAHGGARDDFRQRVKRAVASAAPA